MFSSLAKYYRIAFEDWADPRVENFLFMKSPFPVIAILVFYMYFVFKLGPKLMKNRRPFKINRILVIYNAIQIILCIWLLYRNATTVLWKHNLLCQPIDYSKSELGLTSVNMVWSYFMMKIIDLLDTVFFVLRKKYSQVTFLHVYHHAGMCLLGWMGTKYVAGGHGCLLGLINTTVHVIMYFYYLLTAWDKKYKDNIWWKKHITQLQIVQFLVVTVHLMLVLFQPTCDYPRWIVYSLLPQNALMLILFSNFYIKAYIIKENRNPSNNVDRKTN
ncbi:hypothetical protein PPYR_12162 [Photinus pyralis]|uniref:Elongation of very long chain fatty acids protein n=1 Tax=Photinus pyralis TaxID=7054 RepID=A0A5N4ADB6_PHOPY|nr:elongation of very long chain fatty acids protein 7-like [Photinus pyralis]KAB0795323.1 hypothetical protein PPYR_12162 [Photinus pyralis]